MYTDGVVNVIKKPAVINRSKHGSSCTTCCNIEKPVHFVLMCLEWFSQQILIEASGVCFVLIGTLGVMGYFIHN